tara:strand:- start:27984 stop:28172 length:189 start_codon:yes stop_codon:yes gene_type:complete
MSKVMNYYWDEAEKAVDNIIEKLKDGQIDYDTCKSQILKTDNIDLCSIDEYNVDEVITSETA